jgi:hypothetical protein
MLRFHPQVTGIFPLSSSGCSFDARFLGVRGIYSALVVLALVSGYGVWAFYFALPASFPGLWLLFRLPPRAAFNWAVLGGLVPATPFKVGLSGYSPCQLFLLCDGERLCRNGEGLPCDRCR